MYHYNQLKLTFSFFNLQINKKTKNITTMSTINHQKNQSFNLLKLKNKKNLKK